LYAPNPVILIILIIGAIVFGLVILFLGLCFATLFLPVILILIGLVMLWRGTQGNQMLMMLGGVLFIIGILLWIWS